MSKSSDDQLVTHVPKNFFIPGDLKENHEYEQFFWNQQTIDALMTACQFQYQEQTCCLTTPSLANAWHQDGREEVLLDIDRRFSYLPKYRYYDVTKAYGFENDFRLIILDPPFFAVPIEDFANAVDILTGKNYETKILLGFIKREEGR